MLQAAVVGSLSEQPPIQLAVGIPFVALAKFAAHVEQFFSWKQPLVTQQRAEIGELLPVIARHPPDQRTLPMHHFIVGKRQQKILVVMIEHRESKIVLVILAIDRIALEIAECVVHPAHVPFESETQPPQIRRAGHLRPGG